MEKNPSTSMAITIFQKADNGLLSKSISLGDDGQPKSDGSACLMFRGSARGVEVAGAVELAAIINGLKSSEAISLGVIDDAKTGSTPGNPVNVVTARKLPAPRDGVIARTTEYLVFQSQCPGFMLLDYDVKGMPAAVFNALNAAGGIWDALVETCPGLKESGRVQRASTSAGLFNAETDERFLGSGGLHIYIAVADVSDIPRALKVLHQRLWLADYGWFLVGSTGQLLERSIVDASVGSPERLIFEGAPLIKAPLAQDREARTAVATVGPIIDTRVAIPDLKTEERTELTSLQENARKALGKDSAARRADSDQKLAKKLSEKTGSPISTILVSLRHRHQRKLLPLHPLLFDDPEIGEATVADVLGNPQDFIGETLADPLEGIAYGRCKAKIMGTPATGLIIHSFAHGGMIYHLMFDEAMLETVIANATEKTVLRTFLHAHDHAQLELDEIERLKAIVAKKASIGLRVINRSLKDRIKRRIEEQQKEREAFRPVDSRVKLSAPAPDAELLKTLRPIDSLLIKVTALEPPFRAMSGRYARIVERSITGLHELTSEKQISDENDRLPAPPEPLITELDASGIAMDIEPYIRFEAERQDRDGTNHVWDVRLGTTFANAYSTWPDSKLPIVRGVATLPIVLPGRMIVASNGLNKELSLIFRSNSKLLSVLPDIENATIDVARQAYQYLSDVWLADVDTSPEGKAIAVALALTLIERHLLPARPAWFVTAGQRGGGKTTLLNMISTAVFGRPAAAANWSPAEEERRKAIFSYYAAGIGLLVWDNIPRGSAISCPTIEKALTAAELSDRILGESRTMVVPATTIQAFTGNNVSPKGDLSSRSMSIRLDVQRADPENRQFKHPDPIGWTLANRRKLLKALYVLLMVDREMPADIPTRFKEWWSLIGHPIELCADVSFVDIFRKNDEFDEEANAVASLFSDLRKIYGDRHFTAANIARHLDPADVGFSSFVSSESYDPTKASQQRDRAETLRAALEEAAGGRSFPPGAPSAHRVGKKLQALVARTVLVDAETLTLRMTSHHEGNAYMLVTIT